MSALVLGTGCVTPLGAGPAEVWRRLRAGESVAPRPLPNAETGRPHAAAPVPPEMLAPVSREPRLRRASAISLLAAAAGKAAMAGAGGSGRIDPSRTALVFGVSSGGVQFTRRFFDQVVKQGAPAASPMLFPETVYNAPASHLAALLGLDGATYTLVGDGTVGFQALHFGEQLLALGDADHVLVACAEELDWILLEAHRDWRLCTDGAGPGALLAEGAAAILLGREPSGGVSECAPHFHGPMRIRSSAGHTFFSRRQAGAAIAAALAQELPAPPRETIAPKLHLGEALGASALIQIVLGVEALADEASASALIPSLGWNQQAAAAIVQKLPQRT